MSNFTNTSTIDSFYPPHRTLMGPGPSDISPQVLQALSRPTIGHLDPLFIAMMDEVKQLLKYAFQTENEFTIAVSAPGSAGMETCFVNLIEPCEKVIVCRNGVFGERMRENVVRCGGEAILVDDEWGKPVSVEKVQQALTENPDAVAVAFVHAETSTGALSDAQAISAVARQFKVRNLNVSLPEGSRHNSRQNESLTDLTSALQSKHGCLLNTFMLFSG
ncbi:pyridoxal-phosphate-dependent aminotransferase family protein, partial [Vibrio chagasii]|uniref:pyridoxal-phosphate-dependent aminotransferase family protein n=1 Tax=Vibrio chagasii TaxID=170679 RepID=UPI003462AA20